MEETRILLDPTAELEPAQRERLPRPDSLEGLTVGLLDISKAQGDIFLNRMEAILKERGLQTKRYRKPTFARVAPAELQQQIATECDIAVEALADWGSCTSCSVHDITELEKRGIPGMFVASTEFVEAAEVQSKALGFNPARVFVSHPVQGRTVEEVQAMADGAVDDILAQVTASKAE